MILVKKTVNKFNQSKFRIWRQFALLVDRRLNTLYQCFEEYFQFDGTFGLFHYESINFVACLIIRRSSRLIEDSDFETLQIIAKDLTKFNSSCKIKLNIGLPLSFFMNK